MNNVFVPGQTTLLYCNAQFGCSCLKIAGSSLAHIVCSLGNTNALFCATWYLFGRYLSGWQNLTLPKVEDLKTCQLIIFIWPSSSSTVFVYHISAKNGKYMTECPTKEHTVSGPTLIAVWVI